MEPLRYLDFELKIIREKGGRYIAQVLHSPAGEATINFGFPFSEVKLKNLVLKLGRPRGSTRRIHSTEMEAARELGGKLFDTIFIGEVLACLKSSLDKASCQEEKTGLRLKLRLQEVPELADLPWEFLLDTSLNRFFAQSNQTPIVRYIEMPERIKPITVNLPLHLLVMVSSPTDYPHLDVERERSRLEEALDSLIKSGKVRVKWLENPTLTDLHHCLQEGDYHIFHVIGHGGFDKGREEGVLVLEDEQGRGWLADAHRIGTILHDHPSLRLAVLNSCEGARNSLNDPFAGVAAGLIRQGVPAVVAMQFEITDEAAIMFAGEFYAAVAQGFPVDAAVAEARKAIYIHNDIEWGTPVLYMRSSDGVLFDLTQKPAAEEKQADHSVGACIQLLTQKPTAEEITPSAHEHVVASPAYETVPKAQQPKSTEITPSRLPVAPYVRTLEGHKKAVNSVAFSPDGTIIASGAGGGLLWSNDNTVRLWRVSDGTLIRTLEGHNKQVNSVAFSPDGVVLASGSLDKTVRLWQFSDGKLLRTLEWYEEEVTSVTFSPDGTIIASTSGGATMWLCQVSNGALIRKLMGHDYGAQGVAFSPDGATVVSGSGDNLLWMWRVSDGELLRTLKRHKNYVRSMAFSPDGAILASGSDDKTVRLWQFSDGTLLRTLEGHKKWVTSVAFSPDGAILASGSGDNILRMWRVSDGKLLCKLEGHTKVVNSVAFSPDGKTLASGSDDKTVRLWRVK